VKESRQSSSCKSANCQRVFVEARTARSQIRLIDRHQSIEKELIMKNQIASLAALLVLGLPFGAAQAQSLAQSQASSTDAAYCQALTDKYTTYVADPNEHRPAPANVGVTAAIAECKAGNAAGIPALEKALTNAGVALPSHG
jgi:hypothetical protein